MNIINISIVVPFYNVEEYFRVFLESLLPLDNSIEIILVDDGSKDASINIAKEFVGIYSNVKLVQKSNGGLSSARNFGMKYATGTHIIFFDSDDYIENKSVITEMYELAVLKSSDIVVAPYYEFVTLDKKKYRYDRTDFDDDLNTLNERLDKFYNNQLSFAVWNKMFSTDFLKKNNLLFKEGIWFEDLEFTFRAFFLSANVSKVQRLLIGYRQRSGSIMTTVSPKILDKILVLEMLREFLKEKKVGDEYIEKFKILYLRMTFSVIYSVVINTGSSNETRKIINDVFNFPYFKTIVKEKLQFIKFMSKTEKLFFFLVKYKVINNSNVKLLKKLKF